MKKYYLLPAILLGLGLSSCSDEPENMECDLLSVSVHVADPSEIFYHDYDTLQSITTYGYDKTDIEFTARPSATIAAMPLYLTATAGAKIYHVVEGTDVAFQNGQSITFTAGEYQRFHIVSEDGAWDRYYSVVFNKDEVSATGDMYFDFENYNLDPANSNKFYIWPVTDSIAYNVFTDHMWKNGNPGFKLSKSSAKPLEYPSTPVVGGGPDGSTCLKLETMDTGAFGRMVNMRIASGSMFNGVFDVANALKNALKATRFGSPFTHKPSKMVVWLKWECGATFQDKKANPIANTTDEPDAYVILYRNQDADGNAVMLDGNDVLTNKNIIGLGRLPHKYNEDGSDKYIENTPIHGLTNEWQKVEIPVVYTQEPDKDILANKGYSLVIGFASSWQGAYFQGAVGSKFYIDNISLLCEY